MLLITGANGQLGCALRERLSAMNVDGCGNAFFASRQELDIADFSSVEAFFSRAKEPFSAIVNCAAYTAVDKAEYEPERAREINVCGARNLAKLGVPLVHVSTDYVFAGTACRPCAEEDAPAPRSVYGKTKLEGELAVLETAHTAVVLRTSWLYSRFGNNFLKTMLRLGRSRETLNVVCDQIGTPTHAKDLARAITEILPRIVAGTREIFHFSNEGCCSWFDFAHAIMRAAGLSCKVVPVPSEAYPTKAPRPAFSVLSKEKIKRAFSTLSEIPHWHDSLVRCLQEIEPEAAPRGNASPARR